MMSSDTCHAIDTHPKSTSHATNFRRIHAASRTVLWRSILTPKSRVFLIGLTKEAQNVSLAALNLMDISGVDLEVLGWILGFWESRVFSPKFTCSHFLFKCQLSV